MMTKEQKLKYIFKTYFDSRCAVLSLSRMLIYLIKINILHFLKGCKSPVLFKKLGNVPSHRYAVANALRGMLGSSSAQVQIVFHPIIFSLFVCMVFSVLFHPYIFVRIVISGLFHLHVLLLFNSTFHYLVIEPSGD